MKACEFVKMQGSGNDFIVVRAKSSGAAVLQSRDIVKICDRKFGVGADGVLVLGPSGTADARMRIFNADGSEAQMCGNGARCAVLYLSRRARSLKARQKCRRLTLETLAGTIQAEVKGAAIKIGLTEPRDLKLDIPVVVGSKTYTVDYVNTGVPHAVLEVEDLESVPVRDLGRALRHHSVFAPAGTNVDFVKIDGAGSLRARTYERGVEDETLACGTGSVAGAIIAVLNHGGGLKRRHKVSVKTMGGESLNVYFTVSKYRVTDVWLEGKAEFVFEGKYFDF